MSTQRGKNLAVDRGPLAAGSPSHRTTSTMVNPALVQRNHTTLKIPINSSMMSSYCTQLSQNSQSVLIMNISYVNINLSCIMYSTLNTIPTLCSQSGAPFIVSWLIGPRNVTEHTLDDMILHLLTVYFLLQISLEVLTDRWQVLQLLL